MARLRSPGGCPWDREQTFDSIKPYTVEETYEVLEAIDSQNWDELPSELGDLLLQVLFYAQMASEEGKFSIDDVLDRLSEKLVNRHPHVFGQVKAETSSEVLRNWDAIKETERPQRNAESASILSSVSAAMPGLLEARKLGSSAAKVGFDWPSISGLIDKLDEEAGELRREVEQLNQVGDAKASESDLKARLEGELGDLFFTLVNIARHLSLDSESALKKSNRKFRARFQWMEERLQSKSRRPQDASLEELELLWQQAKKQENNPR